MTAVAQAESACDLTAPWSPEMRVLLACARGRSQSGALRHSLGVPVDWDLLLREAHRHGFSSLLYRELTESPAASVPPGFRQALAERHRAIIQRGLQHTAMLVELMALFRSEGLTALPYKGPVLSAQIFGDPALREAVDLDILLPQDQVTAACRLLTQRGFQPIRVYQPGIEKQLLKYRAEIGMERGGVLVELQWRLAPQYFSVPVDVRALAQRAGRMTIAEAELPVLGVEDNLLLLCVHGAKHHWQNLKWILDVDLLIRANPGLSWTTLQQRTRTLGAERMLRLGLSLGERLLQTPLPADVRESVRRDEAVMRVTEDVLAGLESRRSPSEIEHHRLMLRLRERIADRILYLARLGWQPTESEWGAVTLPPGLHFAYHGVRVGRVLAKALRFTSS